MKSTESGISLMILVFVLMIAVNVVMLLGTAYNGLGPMMFISFIIVIVAVILFLISIYNFIKDSENKGSSHEKDVKYASAFFLAGFFSGSVFFPIQNFFYILGAVFLVKSLGEKIERNLLYSGAGINLLGTIGMFMFFIYGTDKHLSNTTTLALISWTTITFIIGFTFFIISYKRIENRLKGLSPSLGHPFSGLLGNSGYLEAGKKCPKCGKYDLTIYHDRSAECTNCSYSTPQWEGDESDE